MEIRSEHIRRLAKYVISGGLAALVDLGLLYVCTHILHIWYIASSIVAYTIAFFVSFTLQKFWTFSEQSMHHVRRQAILYFTATIVNLGLNTLLMFVFVTGWGLNYMGAQILAAALIAIESFFIYRWIFKPV